MSLGIFNRLWTLLEEACSELDFKLSSRGSSSPSFKKLGDMRVELQTERNYADLITQMITFHTLAVDSADDLCDQLKADLATSQLFISEKVP